MNWTNEDTTAISPSTTGFMYYTDAQFFHYQSSVNITLAVYIMIQNSMIIYDYHKDWRRISSLLFILIAAVDIGNACSEIGRGSVALLCLKNESMRIPPWIFLTCLLIGLFCYVTSTFLGVVLTVVKTINIINPFYRLNECALKILLFIFLSIFLVLCISDVWSWNDLLVSHNRNPRCNVEMGPWQAYFSIDSIGEGTAAYVLDRRLSFLPKTTQFRYIISTFLLSVQFCLPCVIVFVCMVLQMIYVKKGFGETQNPQQNTANQVNLTVFLISLLYLSSVSLFSFPRLAYDIMFLMTSEYYKGTGFLSLIMVGKFTLPLLNAALFPTILILRKPDLRATYRNYITKVFLLPLTVFGKVRHLAQRRRGYNIEI